MFFNFKRRAASTAIYAEVITGLPADYHPLITGVEDFGRNVPSHPNLEQPPFKLFRPRRISVRVREKWWKPRLLDSLDLFHPTYYDLTDGFSFSDFKCPTVLTVYDFIYAIYPKLIEGSEGVIRDQTEAIRKADHIICISKATENNLLERFPEKQGKTSVIYLGSSFEIQPPLAEQAIFEKPSFLFVGRRGGYKNFLFSATCVRQSLRVQSPYPFTGRRCAIDYGRALADTNAGNQRPCRSGDVIPMSNNSSASTVPAWRWFTRHCMKASAFPRWKQWPAGHWRSPPIPPACRK